MKIVRLSGGKVAIVDDEVFDFISKYKWSATPSGNNFYATHEIGPRCCRISVKMHQAIIGMKKGFVIDHIDGNTLNNQRSNLRHVTHRQNCQKRNMVVTPKSSIYPGVCRDKSRKKWMAHITINSRFKSLGRYDSELEAYSAYCSAVKQYFSQEVIS